MLSKKQQTKTTLQQIATPKEDVKKINNKIFAVEPFPVPDNPTVLDGLRQKVFMDRYAWKDEEGKPLEEYPEQAWGRVARTIASVEKTAALRKLWEEKFYYALSDFKFLPGGRILSAAGTGYEVTFYNCFVIPCPEDSRGGILDNLKIMTEVFSRAGGAGVNLSTLRPRGARVKKVNGTSSGPINWANLYSVASHDVIQQGGTRRGALMIMLHDWHPDIEEFVEVKKDTTKLVGANLSVCISDKFMEAVENNSNWDLKFPDIKHPNYDLEWDGDIEDWEKKGYPIKVYKTIQATELWDKICESAWVSAEPGIHFLERSNKWSNTWYFEKLAATNPCLTTDTWIQTNQGAYQIKNLIGKPFAARVNGQDYPSSLKGFFKTDYKQTVELQTTNGYKLKLTQDHLIKKVISKNRQEVKTIWIEAGKLTVGDQINLHNHRYNNYWQGKYSKEEGYLIGLLLGDGTLKKDKAVLSVWVLPNLNGKLLPTSLGQQSIMTQALQAASTIPHRADFNGWMQVKDRNEYRLSLSYIKHLAKELGMSPEKKTITPLLEKTSSCFYQGFLQGLFDCDGSVQGIQEKGVSIRLSQSNLSTLEAVQRMLLRLGIVSKIYQNRRHDYFKQLPDHQGNLKLYPIKAQHELVISGENLIYFAKSIGFADQKKANRLENLLSSYKRKLNREDFTSPIEKITYLDKEDVYDAQIPSVHAFDANGLYVHNCGEQPLPAWGVCNLGSINLSAFVNEEGEFDYQHLSEITSIAVRMLDNVIDANFYFYIENKQQQDNARRIGLGTMGLGDTLIKMKVRYGSDESLEVIEKIYQTIRNTAYETSSELAKEKGIFPKFDQKKYLQGYFIKQLTDSVKEKIIKNGIRNSVLLTQAPTGSTSLLAGVSSGIEPVFDFAMVRKDRIGEHIIYHPLYKKWKDSHPENTPAPDYFSSANNLLPEDHVKVQALIQKYTDSSISKTVNAPNSHTVEDVKKLYMDAYKQGCKGITYMRDGSRDGVLSHISDKPANSEAQNKEQSQVQTEPVVFHRPMVLPGRTYKMLTPIGEVFITINRDANNCPVEVFITIGKAGMQIGADAEAIGRLVSLVLRISNGNRKETAYKIVSQLKGIGGSSHIGFGKDRVMSLADAIAKVLAEDLATSEAVVPETLSLNISENNPSVNSNEPQSNGQVAQQLNILEPNQQTTAKVGDLCPECGNATFVFEEGCKKCHLCGYSIC